MNPYRIPSVDLTSRVAIDEQIPMLPSATPRLDHIDMFGWNSFWNAVHDGHFDSKPAIANGLAMAPMGVHLV